MAAGRLDYSAELVLVGLVFVHAGEIMQPLALKSREWSAPPPAMLIMAKALGKQEISAPRLCGGFDVALMWLWVAWPGEAAEGAELVLPRR